MKKPTQSTRDRNDSNVRTRDARSFVHNDEPTTLTRSNSPTKAKRQARNQRSHADTELWGRRKKTLALWCEEFVARQRLLGLDSQFTMWTARDLAALLGKKYSRGLAGHLGRQLGRRRLKVFSYKIRELMRRGETLCTVWCIPEPSPWWTPETLRDCYRYERELISVVEAEQIRLRGSLHLL